VRLAFQGPVSEASPVSSSRSGAYRVIAALAEDMEKTPSAPALMIGATDSKAMTPVATDIYRFTFIRQDVKDIAMFHGVGEHMTLDNLSRLTRFFTRLIATTTAG
jgi:carboxypeptidase PM20D1